MHKNKYCFFSKLIIISCEATIWLSGWQLHARVQEFCKGGLCIKNSSDNDFFFFF